jgi:Mg/Co/Ni transporter MgtE
MAKVTEVEPRITIDDLASQAKEYAHTKKQIELLEKRQKELREKLFSHIDEGGEQDDKGNLVLELPEDVEGFVAVTKQRRVTRKIDEDVAFDIIEEKGLRDKLIKIVEVVDEDALMAALYNDELTEEEIDEMYPQTVVWALVMNKR